MIIPVNFEQKNAEQEENKKENQQSAFDCYSM